jgi:hypothetical protein
MSDYLAFEDERLHRVRGLRDFDRHVRWLVGLAVPDLHELEAREAQRVLSRGTLRTTWDEPNCLVKRPSHAGCKSNRRAKPEMPMNGNPCSHSRNTRASRAVCCAPQ